MTQEQNDIIACKYAKLVYRLTHTFYPHEYLIKVTEIVPNGLHYGYVLYASMKDMGLDTSLVYAFTSKEFNITYYSLEEMLAKNFEHLI